MASSTQLSILSLLAGWALAIPAAQNDNWRGGDWHPSNWQHWTVGTPLSHASLSTSYSASTMQPSSSKDISTAVGTTGVTGPSLTTQMLSSTTLPSNTAKSTTPASYSLTTSTSASSITSVPNASSTSTASATQAASTATTSGSGKRGMAYNDASYAALFQSADEVTWGYNWYSASNGLSSAYNYVPMLWGSASDFTDIWHINVANSLAAGTTHLLAFNEPDLDSQSNMSPAAAAEAYKSHIQPYTGEAKLCSPAVTNGDSANMGFNWLTSFMAECSGCTIDCVALHWYNIPNTVDDFKSHVTTAYETFGKPVWITEFGLVNNPTDEDVSNFLEEVLPWLDEQDFVERYAYFMVAENYLVDSSGTALSDYGNTFATYSS